MAQRIRRAVLAASAAGGSVREIAVLTGKSTNTIQRWLKQQ
ncbi:helix-turn-helix domain-containing protein [Mycolicibacterium goodii]